MEKRLYGKPLMSMEQFTPSEYVSICWYLDNDCIATLYHDDNGDERYTDNESISHTSHSKIPANPKPYFSTKKGDPSPTSETNDGKYYTAISDWQWDVEWVLFVPVPYRYRAYTTKLEGKIYSYYDGSAKHYFQDYHTVGNHS